MIPWSKMFVFVRVMFDKQYKSCFPLILVIKLIIILCQKGVDTSDALRNLVLFVQFKKREKHPRKSVTFAEVCNFTKSNTPPCVVFTFFKLYKWYQITHSVSYYCCILKLFSEYIMDSFLV